MSDGEMVKLEGPGKLGLRAALTESGVLIPMDAPPETLPGTVPQVTLAL